MTDFSKKFSTRIQNLLYEYIQRSSVALMIEVNHTCQDVSTHYMNEFQSITVSLIILINHTCHDASTRYMN